MKKPIAQPPERSTQPNAEQPFRTPHPLEDLTRVRLSIQPIPRNVYDQVMKRDAGIFKRLAKV